MATSPEPSDAKQTDREDEAPFETNVNVHRTSADRVVFTEADNTDGWIATDLTVDPEP